MSAQDEVRLFQATLTMLQNHLREKPGYPMPVTTKEDLAACVCRAYLNGAAFVAQAAGCDPAPYVEAANRLMDRHARTRGASLILPGDEGFSVR